MQAIKEKLYDCDTQKQKEKEMAKVRTEGAMNMHVNKAVGKVEKTSSQARIITPGRRSCIHATSDEGRPPPIPNSTFHIFS